MSNTIRVLAVIGGVVFFSVGWWSGHTSHPYEHCADLYTTGDDIVECVWILENP